MLLQEPVKSSVSWRPPYQLLQLRPTHDVEPWLSHACFKLPNTRFAYIDLDLGRSTLTFTGHVFVSRCRLVDAGQPRQVLAERKLWLCLATRLLPRSAIQSFREGYTQECRPHHNHTHGTNSRIHLLTTKLLHCT